MSVEDKVLIRRWFEEVWNQGRVAAIDEMLAEHAVVHGLGEDMHGPAEFKRFHSSYRNAFPDVSMQVHDVVAEGGMVAARWSGTGTHHGDGLGFAATGKVVQFSGMTFVRVEQGKVVEGWNVFDQMGMFQQLGAVSLPAVQQTGAADERRGTIRAIRETNQRRSRLSGKALAGPPP